MNFDVIYQGVNPDKALIYMWKSTIELTFLLGGMWVKQKWS